MTRRLLAAFAVLCALEWLGLWSWARLPGFVPLSDGERRAVFQRLRDGLDHKPVAAVDDPALGRAFAGPLLVTLFDRGAPVTRVESRAPTLGAATRDAARALGAAPLTDEQRRRGRIKVDVVLARAPVFSGSDLLFGLSLVPGLDGLGLDFGGHEVLLTVDDLMLADVLSAHTPAPGLEFTIGLDRRAVLRRLADEVHASASSWAATPKRFFRFRADQLIERASHEGALPVVRGNVPGPKVSAASLRAAAEKGGRYLLRHLRPDGKFEYEYYPSTDQFVDGDYSLPRHSGAVYFLAQMFGATHDPAYIDGFRRGIGWLERQIPPACDRPDRACVGERDDRQVDLGAAALTLTALSEYERVSGFHAYASWAQRLAEFILFMQKPDGDFCHVYQPASDQRNERDKMLYYSGEAAFALAKLLLVPGLDPARAQRYATALDRGLDYLTGKQYAHLAGQFFFLEDHWTCMATDAGWEHLPSASRERYGKFCDQFAAFLRRTQFTDGEAVVRAQPDFLGAYGFSPFLPPHATPVGSRSETSISTFHLQTLRHSPAAEHEATRRQILLGMQFLLNHQIDDDGAWLMRDPDAARGGLLMSDVARHIRIDFVQHASSAMLRAVDLF